MGVFVVAFYTVDALDKLIAQNIYSRSTGGLKYFVYKYAYWIFLVPAIGLIVYSILIS